eukprot:snap_masked-scaffold_12-processed-gene-8.46-mRNA-1 protein AED:1.00 eAED:1.00 QI:0/0/0/0/1/1/3/0/62
MNGKTFIKLLDIHCDLSAFIHLVTYFDFVQSIAHKSLSWYGPDFTKIEKKISIALGDSRYGR